MWTVPTYLDDPLTSYDSLTDPHLSEYFKRPCVREHLFRRGIITTDGEIVPDAKKRLSSDRRRQLQRILDELIESAELKSTPNAKDRNVLVGLLDEKIQSRVQAFYELKELERMVNAQLVLKAKKTYLKERSFGGTSKVSFLGQDDRQITCNQRIVYQQRRQGHPGENVTASRKHGYHSDIKSNKGLEGHSDTTHQSLLADDRPPSTYGLRSSRRNSVVNGDAFFSSTDALLPLQTNIGATSSPNKESSVLRRQHRQDIDRKTSSSKRDNNNNNANRKEGNSPRELFSDILSLDGESLHGSSFEEGIKKGKHLCPLRGGDIARHERSTKDFPVDEGERTASRLAKEERKSISAQLTLRFEGMSTRASEKEKMRRGIRNGDDDQRAKTRRMIKVSQEISRGASSFLVFSDDVMPGSDFKFYVYRRNNHPFSLCLLIDNVRDVRISTCCEMKHQPGVRLGHFRIIDIRLFTDPSTGHVFRCDACIKGISWSQWIRRSRRRGRLTQSPDPLPSPVRGTPSLSEGDKIPSSSRSSSVPSISEMDYKEELDEYNREAFEEYTGSSAEAVTDQQQEDVMLQGSSFEKDEEKKSRDLFSFPLKDGEEGTLVSQKNEMRREEGEESNGKTIEDTNSQNRSTRHEGKSNRVESIDEDVDSLSSFEAEEVVEIHEGFDEEGG